MALNVHMVTIDSTDPRSLSTFWAAALDLVVALDDGESVYLAPAGGEGLMVSIEPANSRSQGANRLRLNISGEPIDDAVRRLIGLGATAVSAHEVPGVVWQILADPEGNQFAVVEHM
ncbi:VOC family protein [Nocardia sp. NPDC059246]|uniref:VOC family protein n=1 Tax=unclassified Nocardia TaxID=2637762 RepID=UPI0036CF7C1D